MEPVKQVLDFLDTSMASSSEEVGNFVIRIGRSGGGQTFKSVEQPNGPMPRQTLLRQCHQRRAAAACASALHQISLNVIVNHISHSPVKSPQACVTAHGVGSNLTV